MSAIGNAVRGVLGLFFDDGTLALVILALLIAVGFARHGGWIGDSATIGILVTGNIAALLENVVRSARRKGRGPTM
jgi:hypothetical protein